MKLVSVIIPTYNREEMVLKCVNSILASTYKNLELIVVDNCSTDSTVDRLEEVLKDDNRIKIVKLAENLMAAGGRNKGIEVAKGDYLLFIDNDNLIDPKMIEILVQEMDNDDNIGLVGPLSINKYSGDTIWMASGDYNFFTSRPKAKFAEKKIDEVELLEKYETCYSPNIMMISKKAIESVGGFDESYYAMYEEADIGYRIKNYGYTEYIVTRARTYHLNYVGDGENDRLRFLGIGFPERAFHYAKNRTIFMRKYAKWYHMITYYLIFIHIFTWYYFFQALRFNRIDIANAWIKGTVTGLFTRMKN